MKYRAHTRIYTAVALIALAFTMVSGAGAQTETILHSFTAGADGGEPIGGLISDTEGNLYGATEIGGENSAGAIYEMTPSTSGTWTETVLYSFSFTSNQGIIPSSGLVFDKQGNLYGVAEGGTSGAGVIYGLSPGLNGVWTETAIYNFSNGTDGSSGFLAGLAVDASGNLYGTTQNGGAYGYGTVFVLVRGTNGSWSKKILHSFSYNDDGGEPFAENLVLDTAGNVYGTTLDGGAHDYGVVFELIRGSSGSWSEKVLHSFTGGADGSGPEGGLTLDAAGNLYGCSSYSVFQLVPTSSGEWTENILHTFTGGTDGSGPDSAPTFDKAGNLFGTTNAGGKHRGTVFELTHQANGTWTERILHRFAETGGDGTFPFYTELVIDSKGNLYGTAGGGTSNDGVVFEVTP